MWSPPDGRESGGIFVLLCVSVLVGLRGILLGVLVLSGQELDSQSRRALRAALELRRRQSARRQRGRSTASGFRACLHDVDQLGTMPDNSPLICSTVTGRDKILDDLHGIPSKKICYSLLPWRSVRRGVFIVGQVRKKSRYLPWEYRRRGTQRRSRPRSGIVPLIRRLRVDWAIPVACASSASNRPHSRKRLSASKRALVETAHHLGRGVSAVHRVTSCCCGGGSLSTSNGTPSVRDMPGGRPPHRPPNAGFLNSRTAHACLRLQLLGGKVLAGHLQ